MRSMNKNTVWGALAVVCLVAAPVMAQNKIDDSELLNMLGSAESKTANGGAVIDEVEAAPVAVEPMDRVLASVKAADQRAADADAAVDELAATSVDAVAMDVFDEKAGSSEGELITVRLNKVGLEEAISLFAQLSGANIIVPELTEAAQISVNLKDVEWRPALQSILDTYNYELYQRVAGSNVFSVRRRPAGAPEPQVVETFKLRYATVPNVAVLIRGLLPEDAKVSEFASRNMIVVKSTESSLGEVRAMLETIDTVRQQVFIESKFMELNDGSQLDLGFDWKQLGLNSKGEGGVTAKVGAETLTYADGRQVSSLGPAAVVDDFSEHIFTSVLDVDQFELVLNALESDRGVSVVSNPKVIVANEEKANISIVRKEPNLKQERQQTAGAQGGAAIDNIVYSLDPDMPFFEYGITLDVTPSVNTSSNITVSINPSLTRKYDDKEAGDNTYPIIDAKTIQTVFSLASGQTAAIGGLTEVSDSEKVRKVPYLGSIPFIGRLFSWKQIVSDQTETIIFVTVGLADTTTIEADTGLPEDSELARRRMIRDRNEQAMRAQSREIYQTIDSEETEDGIKAMQQEEQERMDDRNRMLEKEAAKVANR